MFLWPRALRSLHKVSFTTLRKDENRRQPGKTGWEARSSLLVKEMLVEDVLRLE